MNGSIIPDGPSGARSGRSHSGPNNKNLNQSSNPLQTGRRGGNHQGRGVNSRYPQVNRHDRTDDVQGSNLDQRQRNENASNISEPTGVRRMRGSDRGRSSTSHGHEPWGGGGNDFAQRKQVRWRSPINDQPDGQKRDQSYSHDPRPARGSDQLENRHHRRNRNGPIDELSFRQPNQPRNNYLAATPWLPPNGQARAPPGYHLLPQNQPHPRFGSQRPPPHIPYGDPPQPQTQWEPVPQSQAAFNARLHSLSPLVLPEDYMGRQELRPVDQHSSEVKRVICDLYLQTYQVKCLFEQAMADLRMLIPEDCRPDMDWEYTSQRDYILDVPFAATLASHGAGAW